MSYTNSQTNKSGEEKERIVYNVLSKKYNYVLENGNGKNIVIRIEVKGFREIDNSTFSNTDVLFVEKYKFDSYTALMLAEEVESCILFSIGDERHEKLEYYWETIPNLLNINYKIKYHPKWKCDCYFWKAESLKRGMSGFMKYLDSCLESYW